MLDYRQYSITFMVSQKQHQMNLYDLIIFVFFYQIRPYSQEYLKMEQLGEVSATGFLNKRASVMPEALSNSKTGGVRYSFQQRNSKQSRGSNLRGTAANAFEKARWQVAQQRLKKKSNRYYKNEQIGLGVDIEHFKIYGAGIFLFFSFLKNLVVAFGMMAVVKLFPIIYNYYSGQGLLYSTASINYYFAKTSIGAFSSDEDNISFHKYCNVVTDMLYIFIFIAFYFYWLYRSDILTQEVHRQVKMRSYTVIQLIEPPSKATQNDVHSFFSQFGNVTQVAAVRNYDETIYLSKKIYDLEVEIKQLQFKLEYEKTQQLKQQIQQKKSQMDEIYKQLVLYEDDVKEEIISFYVSFATIEQKQKALKQLEPYRVGICSCCADMPPQNFLLLGERVKVEACHTQPGQIIWQNQHVTWKTRWMRAVTQIVLLLIVVSIGFLLISFLNILAPPTTQTVNTSAYTQTTIQAETNSTILQSWCVSNAASVVSDSSSTLYTTCWPYIENYYLKIAVTIGIAVAVLIIKALIKIVVVFLAKFQRYKSHNDQSKDIIQNLLLTYLFTTVLITILLQASVGNISFKSLISYFINSSYLQENLDKLKEYNDFTPDWYMDIGYQILITWIVTIVHPCLIMPFVNYLDECLKTWKAKREEVQTKMEKILQPMQFQIEDHYANILMLVYVSVALSPGMPIIAPIAFLALLLRFFYLKHEFIRFCKIPKTYDEALDLKVTKLLPYSVILHFILGLWMFGVPDIFQSDTSSVTEWVNSLNYQFFDKIGLILSRSLGTWYFFMLFVLYMFIIAFKIFFYNLIVSHFIKKEEGQIIKIKSASEDDSLNKSFKNLCNSYRIQSNPDYQEILTIMRKKRKFVVRVKDLNQS